AVPCCYLAASVTMGVTACLPEDAQGTLGWLYIGIGLVFRRVAVRRVAIAGMKGRRNEDARRHSFQAPVLRRIGPALHRTGRRMRSEHPLQRRRDNLPRRRR